MTTTPTPSARAETTAVEIRGLVKTFGHTRALDGLDMTVAQGSVTGFLGPNGAGKSTTIRVLLGLLRSDGGTVRLLGRDPWRDAVALHRRADGRHTSAAFDAQSIDDALRIGAHG